ncbi:MAG TPA: hypothetical protein VHX20_17940 [Terracidiphilus sp.]|jgi:hypothetical protein|nr:hypothetical protein [Terracidiphilus sp.]
MRSLSRNIASLLLAAACISPVFMAGCAVHARVYDPYYHDYHPWGGETVYYQQWEHDTHRQHEDFKHRNKADQKDYWTWRHDHH